MFTIFLPSLISVYHPWWICLEFISLAEYDIQNPTHYDVCELLTIIIIVNNTVCKICGFGLKFPFISMFTDGKLPCNYVQNTDNAI